MNMFQFVKKTLIFTAFIAVSSIFVITFNHSAYAAYASNIAVGDLNSLSNQERTNAGLAPLNLNSQLSAAAYAKANHMIANNYWAHIAPDGTAAWSFITAAGYQYTSAGENLAKDFSTSSGVVSGWMASPTHRANLLSSTYNDVGYAVVNGVLLGTQTTLVVAIYGATNSSAPITSSAAPTSNTPKTTTTTDSSPIVTTTQVARSTDATPVASSNNSSAVKPKTTSKEKVSIANQGEVAGATVSLPSRIYKSLKSWFRPLILVVSITFLIVAIRYVLTNRKDCHGRKYTRLSERPVFDLVVLIIPIMMTISSLVIIIR